MFRLQSQNTFWRNRLVPLDRRTDSTEYIVFIAGAQKSKPVLTSSFIVLSRFLSDTMNSQCHFSFANLRLTSTAKDKGDSEDNRTLYSPSISQCEVASLLMHRSHFDNVCRCHKCLALAAVSSYLWMNETCSNGSQAFAHNAINKQRAYFMYRLWQKILRRKDYLPRWPSESLHLR